MSNWTIFDIECDGFNPTKIYCVAAMIDGEIYSITDYDDMRRYFTSYETYIGHYITLFDIPVVERILDIKVKGQLIDTLPLSWYLFPDRKKHGLEEWGVEYGIPKPLITDWFTEDLSVYINRCVEDVKINARLWKEQNEYLKKLYPEPRLYTKFIKYLQWKMECIREQEEEGWKLDVEKARTTLAFLEEEKTKRTEQLVSVMPKVPVKAKRAKPKSIIKADGTYTKNAMGWYQLLIDQGLPVDFEGPVDVVTGYEEPTPSPVQLKAWLHSLGWVPQTFKPNAKGEEVEQISLPNGAGLCESVKDLFEVEPKLEVLDGYSVLGHRIGVLSGFLRDVSDTGFLQATVAGLTNTLRFKHATVVNLPKVDKLYAESIRGSLTVPAGFTLCGADLASLEDRLKQHYIYNHDPDYVKTMLEPDFDPHLDLAVRGEMITKEQADAYRAGDTRHKNVRSAAKTTNYACQYGAGAAKIAKATGLPLQQAKLFHETYWNRNWAVKTVAEEQTVKYVGDDMWLQNPVNGFMYSLRAMKDRFSTLVQGTASYAFDVWVGLIRNQGVKITAQFHDEFVARVVEGDEQKMYGVVQEAMLDCNDILDLNRQLDFECKFGKYYSEIH